MMAVAEVGVVNATLKEVAKATIQICINYESKTGYLKIACFCWENTILLTLRNQYSSVAVFSSAVSQ